MDFVTLLHGAATAFGRIEQFAGETLRHGLFRTLLGRFTEPAHGEGHTADRTDFDRNLIVGTTNAAGLDFHQRTDVVQAVVNTSRAFLPDFSSICWRAP